MNTLKNSPAQILQSKILSGQENKGLARQNLLKRSFGGFTLIELLVAIAILGVLASIVFISVANARQKAKIAAAKSEIRQIAFAMEMFRDTHGCLPPVGDDGSCDFSDEFNNLSGGTCDSSWGDVVVEELMSDNLISEQAKTDPWGNPYCYDKNDGVPTGPYSMLYSMGPDYENNGLEQDCETFTNCSQITDPEICSSAGCLTGVCSGSSFYCNDITDAIFCATTEGCQRFCQGDQGCFVGTEDDAEGCSDRRGSCNGGEGLDCSLGDNDPFVCDTIGICAPQGQWVCHDCSPENCQPQWNDEECGAHGGIMSECGEASNFTECVEEWHCPDWQHCTWNPLSCIWYGVCGGGSAVNCNTIPESEQCGQTGVCAWLGDACKPGEINPPYENTGNCTDSIDCSTGVFGGDDIGKCLPYGCPEDNYWCEGEEQ